MIKWILKKCTKLYKTYNTVRNVFIEPKLHFHCGWWKHSPGLPVWRRGPQIRLGKYGDYTTAYRYAKLLDSQWTPIGKKRHPILSRLCKPVIQLPIWMTFRIFNHDLFWKTKWGEYRYEFPPQFSIIIFGYAFEFWLKPEQNEDHYWEAILAYKYVNNPNYEPIINAGKAVGVWQSSNGPYWGLSLDMLKSPYKEKWKEYQNQHKLKNLWPE